MHQSRKSLRARTDGPEKKLRSSAARRGEKEKESLTVQWEEKRRRGGLYAFPEKFSGEGRARSSYGGRRGGCNLGKGGRKGVRAGA